MKPTQQMALQAYNQPEKWPQNSPTNSPSLLSCHPEAGQPQPPGTEALEVFREPSPPPPPPLRLLRRLMELDLERMSSPRSNMAAAAAAKLTGRCRSPPLAGRGHFRFSCHFRFSVISGFHPGFPSHTLSWQQEPLGRPRIEAEFGVPLLRPPFAVHLEEEALYLLPRQSEWIPISSFSDGSKP